MMEFLFSATNGRVRLCRQGTRSRPTYHIMNRHDWTQLGWKMLLWGNESEMSQEEFIKAMAPDFRRLTVALASLEELQAIHRSIDSLPKQIAAALADEHRKLLDKQARVADKQIKAAAAIVKAKEDAAPITVLQVPNSAISALVRHGRVSRRF